MLKLFSHRIACWVIHWQENEEAIHQFRNRCSATMHGESEMPPAPWDRHPFTQIQRKFRQTVNHENIARCAYGLSGRVRRRGAGLNYSTAESLDRYEGVVIVWAGMHGIITLIAVQTLPVTASYYSFLLLVTMLVTTGPLAIQGPTLPVLVRVARPAMAGPADEEEKAAVIPLLINAVYDVAFVDTYGVSQQAASIVLTGAADPDTSGAYTTMSVPGLDKISQTAPDLENNESLNPTTKQHGLAYRQDKDVVISPAAVTKAWAGPTWCHDELTPIRERTLGMIHAQRGVPLDAGDEGLHSISSLGHTLSRLDYQEIMLTSDSH